MEVFNYKMYIIIFFIIPIGFYVAIEKTDCNFFWLYCDHNVVKVIRGVGKIRLIFSEVVLTKGKPQDIF